jgi:hypothetical protein
LICWGLRGEIWERFLEIPTLRFLLSCSFSVTNQVIPILE